MAAADAAHTGDSNFDLEDRIRGTLYGNCIGDAIGLLTEFMIKKEAKKYYEKHETLEFEHKVPDMHRQRWKTGDWTDDSDQMILILQSILDNYGRVNPVDFGNKLLHWARYGFKELGDYGGMGIGATTSHVLKHEKYKTDPHEAARDIWEKTDRVVAPNGGVMRTSVLGVYQYDSLPHVQQNALNMCKVTHADPRCQASCVAVTTAIALMLQRRPEHLTKNGDYKIGAIIDFCCAEAKKCIPESKMHSELKKHMYADKLSTLKLDESGKIGYTLKCMGSGFWALRQNDFRKAMTELVMEAGDADTNAAVAGAMLGCKLGAKNLPDTWLNGLCHKDWLDEKIDKFLVYVLPERASEKPVEPAKDEQETMETGSVEKPDETDPAN